MASASRAYRKKGQPDQSVLRNEGNPLKWTWRLIAISMILANLVTPLFQLILVGILRDEGNDEDHAHGFLILLICTHFDIWERRRRLQGIVPGSAGW